GLIGGTLIGARDPIGIRPLSIGRLEGGYALASETAALDLMGAQYVREVRPGEMVAIDGDGLRSIPFAEGPARARVCAFELIYFSRPDSLLGGRSVYQFRKRLGAELAAEAPVDADFVTPVPDTGAPAALGFSQALGAPLEYGLTRNDYAGRTFIEPDPDMRARRVREKHAANSALLKGRRVALIDDSLVRGVTARRVIEAVRAAGATEVHLRIACPPIRHPCYYGIDTPDAEELMAARRTPAEIAEEIGADSLAFLSIDGLYRAYGEKAGRGERPALTDHCFTGDYPTPLTDLSRREAAFPAPHCAANAAAKETERP
ncbi:MAG: amidophosphoribosyltransferase, partial [Pseudomonadota bacterium]